MKKGFIALLIGLVTFSLGLTPFVSAATANDYAKYLSAADIKQVPSVI